MQYYISLILASAVAVSATSLGAEMNAKALSIVADCRDNPECAFKEQDMIIDVTLTNISPHEIGLPQEQLKKQGPYCSLTDNETQTTTTLRISLIPDDLRKNFVKIQPGESIKISKKISGDLIKSFREEHIDITVDIGLGGFIETHPGRQPDVFTEMTEVKIRGIDTIEVNKRHQNNQR